MSDQFSISHIDFGEDPPTEGIRIKFTPAGIAMLILVGYQKSGDQERTLNEIVSALNLAYEQGKRQGVNE